MKLDSTDYVLLYCLLVAALMAFMHWGKHKDPEDKSHGKEK